MTDTRELLRQLATQIRDERKLGANTANRVGSLLLAIIDAGADIEELASYFLCKDRPDKTDYLLEANGGLTSDLLQSQVFTPGSLGSGYLIKRDPKTGKSYIEVDELYVRMKAIFDSLEIRESQHVAGQLILSCASIKCSKVEVSTYEELYDIDGNRLLDLDNNYLFGALSPAYRCYFTADDGTKAVLSQFTVGDFAQCRQFNIKEGAYENISNRYYWRYVVSVGDDYIDLSVEDCDEGSDTPEAGDTIIQLGNRTDPARQNAIILSSYGDNAPSKQMLQGISSYSLANRVVLEEGFDRITNQPYTKNYGRSYIGSGNEESYMRYTPEQGVEVKGNVNITGGTIKLQVDEKNAWEVDENCVNTIGDKNGQRIVIDPATRDIKFFDNESKFASAFNANRYDSINDVYYYPIVDTIIDGIPAIYEVSSPYIDHAKQIYPVGNIEVKTPFRLTYSYIASIIQTSDQLQDIYYSVISICLVEYTDYTYTKVKVNHILKNLSSSSSQGYFDFNSGGYMQSDPMPAGFYQVIIVLVSYIKVGKATLLLNDLDLRISSSGYASNYYANGLLLGSSSDNMFFAINKKIEEGGIENDVLEYGAFNRDYGVNVLKDNLLARRNNIWGHIPSVICAGRVFVTSSGATLIKSSSFYNDAIHVYRRSIGQVEISCGAWGRFNLSKNAYVMLTGIGNSIESDAPTAPLKATFLVWYSNGFAVTLSDDASRNDGEFFFELKLY